MTKHKDFVATDEKGKVGNLKKFATNIVTVGAQVGYDAPKILLAQADADNIEWIVDRHDAASSELISLTTLKNEMIDGEPGPNLTNVIFTVAPLPPSTLKPGIIRRHRDRAAEIKGHTGCTPEIISALGIEGAEIVVDEATMKPTAKLKSNLDNGITIDILKGEADGIAVYCRIITDDEAELTPGQDEVFAYITTLISSPYIDLRLNKKHKPETRIYKFYYIRKNKLVGLASDPLPITAKVYIAPDGSELQGQVK